MSELSDNPELQTHSQAVLYILSAVAPPSEAIEAIGDSFVRAIDSSEVWAPFNLIDDLPNSILVMAHPPEFVADPRCILLSQSHGHFKCERL